MSATRREFQRLRRIARRFKAWLRDFDVRRYGAGKAGW